jgi:hypothetical protein
MSEKKSKPITQVILRSYPKVIFLYPLLIVSFILWLLQMLYPDPIPGFGTLWMIVFFVNLFIMAFDFSSAKFFVLLMIVVILVLLLFFLILPNLNISFSGLSINLGITAEFYLITTLVLVFILGIVVLSSRFDYWKIERNEIYHKKGIFSSAERIPTKSLRIMKEIPDVFEFFALRAGRITLAPGHGDVIPLNTVVNVNKKQNQIDYLLSYVSVESDELDGV